MFSPPNHSRPRLTRSQKRDSRHRYAERNRTSPPTPFALDMSAADFMARQEQDESLDTLKRAAQGEATSAGVGFFERDGLLYRRWTPPGAGGEEMAVEQLVLPRDCREGAMKVAHQIPIAGHMGKNKTARRLLQRFYWPSLYRDVAQFRRSCTECQKTSRTKVPRAPLISLPVIGEPFERIAMDIVGPLPRSRSGNKYILVVCDYATRYPEAIPLRTIDAEQVAVKLVEIFSRLGIPKEILTDQGSNFMSQLMKEVYRLLHVEPLRTSPYHPQTDGLVERFNKTLKCMLRTAAITEGKDWDKLLPYLLFAYREVPQDSTGFSPFELLYGRPVRGPLDVQREAWEVGSRSDENIISYVLSMREKLARMSELVGQNMKEAQQNQKKWYDRNARVRDFEPGEQVLVLLPTLANKLQAQCQGPYQVLRRVGAVDYMIDMHDSRKRKRILHVNMLRKWHTVDEASYFTEEVPMDDDSGDVPMWNEGAQEDTDANPRISAQLDPTQQADLQKLLDDFKDVFSNKPGLTNLASHSILAGAAHPVRQPPYRLPHAYRDTVLKDLEEMEESGIIEPSDSDWASPMVLVKKDGSIRMCVDYRKLNSVSQVDAYPMPRVDDLIDRLGTATYLTTLDLTRGYWQVPVEERSRAKTAFTTLRGLFQFRVMPFGLHGAPATFQRLMDGLIRGQESFAAAYLDDLIIFSSSLEEHLAHVRTVLERIQNAGLTVKMKKCQFAMAQCSYLGHLVGSGVVKPEESKLGAIQEFPTPTTKKHVRTFLGLTGYYRRFIPGYAALAVPLTDLTRKNAATNVDWTRECDVAFRSLKAALCSEPVLRNPDFNQPFLLQTDASDRAVGAVLSQHDPRGEEHPIAYFSRKLLPRETRYSTIEKECLAIRLATHVFRVYLLGRKFEIQTDHRALEWLDRLKDNNSRLTRWSLALQPYDYTVIYRSGKENANADALSRIDLAG